MAELSPDVGAFLARLVRLDPAALVRVRADRPGHFDLWAALPWRVLVARTVPGAVLAGATATDVTVRAAEWLARGDGDLSAVPVRDAAWRGALPPSAGTIRESIPTAEVRRVATAAEATLRDVASGALGDRAVGQRAVRDALLDHVPIVVDDGGERIEVSQRLVQAVTRMGFLGNDSDPVRIRTISSWVGVSAAYGVAWGRRKTASRQPCCPPRRGCNVSTRSNSFARSDRERARG